jgi:hypothetical protein
MASNQTGNITSIPSGWRNVLQGWLTEKPACADAFVGIVAQMLATSDDALKRDTELNRITVRCRNRTEAEIAPILADELVKLADGQAADQDVPEPPKSVRWSTSHVWLAAAVGVGLLFGLYLKRQQAANHAAEIERAASSASVVSMIRLPEAAGTSDASLRLIGEVYRVEQDSTRYILDVGDFHNNATFYDCAPVVPPTRKNDIAKPLPAGLQGPEPVVKHGDIRLHCKHVASPEVQFKTIRQPPGRWYRSGDAIYSSAWGKPFTKESYDLGGSDVASYNWTEGSDIGGMPAAPRKPQ